MEQIMKDKYCSFEFHKVDVEEVIFIFKLGQPPGTDNLDGKLQRLVAEYIVTPVCQIFNLGKGHSATQE
jgi:hypothetical protein